MATKDRATRISSLFSLTNTQDRTHGLRSAQDEPPNNRDGDLASPAILSPQLSQSALSPKISASLAPPTPLSESRSSSPARSRASSPFSELRRPWRSRSQPDSLDLSPNGPDFWLLTGQAKVPYDVAPLKQAHKVPELWDDAGDTLVYLFPRSFNPAPSFRVHSSFFSSSALLASLTFGDQPRSNERYGSIESFTSNLHLSVPVSPPPDLDVEERGATGPRASPEQGSPRQESRLYFPFKPNVNKRAEAAGVIGKVVVPEAQLSPESAEELVMVRNLFAFLVRQPLVASARYPTLFSIFMKIADYLRDLNFSNVDGQIYGEIPCQSFSYYVQEHQLGDVRQSREKTIEGLILGERLKSIELYNEAFVHAVGKYEALKKSRSPLFDFVSRTTRNRMERSFMDLQTRVENVRARLTDFVFPSLFVGIANSTTSDESKTVHFKAWKASFGAFRRHVMSYYKQQLGSWPPKASNKKNEFEESGLNRMVLRILYDDMTDIYDLLVDRTALTSRCAETPIADGQHSPSLEEPTPRALRRIMSEYDRSSPPVQPPIPFDTPKLPAEGSGSGPGLVSTTRSGQDNDPNKKMRDNDIDKILTQSYNYESMKDTPFIASYQAFERKAARNKSLREICDQRNGYWIFLYAVLQSLPMLVIDAPGLKWTNGVEYFLCQTLKGGAPWSREDSGRKKNWYGVPGGAGMVSLPPDIVDHGVEGIYRRSHCWVAAEQWTDKLDAIAAAAAHSPATAISTTVTPDVSTTTNTETTPTSDTAQSPPLSPQTRPRNHSQRLSALALGFETLPVPAGVYPHVDDTSRRSSTHDPNRSFADIIPETKDQPVKRWWVGT